MAAIIGKREFVVCVNKTRFKVYVKGRSKPIAVYETSDKDTHSSDKTTSDDKTSEESDGRILACRFSPSGRYFAVCNDCKQLKVWMTNEDNNREWTLQFTRTVVKRCTALTFNNKEDYILLTDKAGDVYRFSVLEPEKPADMILGHLSMLLDVVVSEDDKFVITADRDEKIRVSHYPNGYNIHNYCLAHTDFVSRLMLLPWQPEVLITGSGDGTIRAWNFSQGQLLDTFKLYTEENQTLAVSCISCSAKHNLAAVLVEKNPTVWVVQIQGNSPKVNISQLCKLDTTVPPWDVSFHDNIMCVLLPNSTKPLSLYKYESDDKVKPMLTVLSNDRDDEDTRTFQTIRNDWDFFKDCAPVEPFYSHLHKKAFNNVQEYLSRKKERLQKSTKQDVQETSTSPQTKRQKSDS
ncbi:tRNA (guanine-N(7)-)-methyltransferase non-catalytic subunit wdr4-like [Glandiceps talaboti]